MHHRAMVSDTTIYNKLPHQCTFDLEMIHVEYREQMSRHI